MNRNGKSPRIQVHPDTYRDELAQLAGLENAARAHEQQRDRLAAEAQVARKDMGDLAPRVEEKRRELADLERELQRLDAAARDSEAGAGSQDQAAGATWLRVEDRRQIVALLEPPAEVPIAADPGTPVHDAMTAVHAQGGLQSGPSPLPASPMGVPPVDPTQNGTAHARGRR